jgi:hypothetical protein
VYIHRGHKLTLITKAIKIQQPFTVTTLLSLLRCDHQYCAIKNVGEQQKGIRITHTKMLAADYKRRMTVTIEFSTLPNYNFTCWFIRMCNLVSEPKMRTKTECV